jgi:hypothetical protein
MVFKSIVDKTLLEPIILSWIQHKITRKIIWKIWKQSVEDTANQIASSIWLPEYSDLFVHRIGVVRHFHDLVQPSNHPVFTTDDLAISLAFERHSQGQEVNAVHISQISYIFVQRLFSNLNQNISCRKYLQEESGIKTPEIIRGIVGVSEQTQSLLSSKDRLIRAYFSSYSCKNGSININVHPKNDGGYIDYSESNTIPVSCLSEASLSLGFFRIGFDYQTADGSWLKAAGRSKKHLYEVGFFGSSTSTDRDVEILWRQ